MLRGFRDARLHAFTLKFQANFLLVERVLSADRHELRLLEAQWTLLNRAPVPERQWSPEQKRFLDHVLRVLLHCSLCAVSDPRGCPQLWLLMLPCFLVVPCAFMLWSQSQSLRS